MKEMLPGMLSIAATWGVLYVVCIGVGLLCTRLICRREWNMDTILVSFWLGWCAIVASLQVWQIFLPVHGAVLPFVVAAGAIGLVLNGRALFDTLRRGVRGSSRFGLVLAAAFAGGLGVFGLWLTNRAMGPVTPYDAGLYHLTSMRWLTEHPIVPGLGNLQHRLSNISSYFLFHSLVDAAPCVYQSYNIVSGLLLMAAMSQVLLSAWSLLVGEVRAWHVLRVLFLAPILRMCFFDVASTSPDVPVFLLGAAVAVETAKALAMPDTGRGGVVRVVLLSCVGLTMKLSFTVLGALSSLTVIVAQFLQRSGQTRLRRARLLAAPLGVAALVLLPYAARNVVTGGYPAYHSTLFGFAVPWRVPERVARHEALLVRAWAIRPSTPPAELFANSKWVLPWLRKTLGYYRLDMDAPLLMAIIAIALGVVGGKARGGLRGAGRWLWFLLIPVCAIVFWFSAAPAPRFAGAAFWWLGGGAFLLCLHMWRLPASRPSAVAALLASAILAVGFHVRLEKFLNPGPLNGFHPIPEMEMQTFVTDWGLALRCPVEGDQCWDAALPCTPYPNPSLRLRKAGDLRSGFVIQDNAD